MVKKRTKNRTQDKRTKDKSTKDKVENSRRTADWNLEVRGQKERKARG